MRINSYLLKIIINTNLPGDNQDKLEFKRNMLYHPELKDGTLRLEDYPYFSDNVKYPVNKLKALSYSEIVSFFFNQRQFNQILRNETIISSDSKDFNDLQKDVVDSNIMSMFLLLFPTVFPFEDDYVTSYELITGTEKTKPFFKNPFSGSASRYSYFKMNNAVFTIKSIIWINDLLNHPSYEGLIEGTNSIRDVGKKKIKQIKDNGNKTNSEILNFMNECIEKIYEGFRLSLSRISPEVDATRISIGKETAVFIRQVLQLQFLLLYSQGTQKTEITLYQLKTMKKMLETANKSDIILPRLSDIISNNDPSILSGNDFSSQQKVLIHNINLMKICIKDKDFKLKSFTTINGLTSHERSESQISTLISEINMIMKDKICTKTTSIGEQLTSYDKLNRVLKGEPSEVSFSGDESTKKKYEYFKSFILKKYKAPSRETSNIYLQTLINSDTTEVVTKYFQYFNAVFDYYIENYGEQLSEQERELLNVGVCSINMESKGVPHREIYILMDFIDGEVNAQNKSTIFCPFSSEYLGNQFEKLMQHNEKENLLWSIDDDERSIFKIGNLTSKNESKASPGQKLELIEERPGANRPPPPPQQVNNIDNGDLVTWLTMYVLPTDQKDILGSIEKMNKVHAEPLEKEELVDFIMKNGRELYGIMKKMFTNKDKYSTDTIQYLIGLQGKYETTVKQNDNLLKTKYAAVNFNIDENEKNKLIYSNEMLALFNLVVGYLLDFERKKQTTKGGKKTKKQYYITKGRKTAKLF